MRYKLLLVKLFFSFSIVFFLSFVISHQSKVSAQGLTVDWGDPNPFNATNMLPGDSAEKDISITNNEDVPRIIAIKGELVEEEKDFAGILDIEITQGAAFIYGGPGDPKKLDDFLADSSAPNGIILFPLDPDETAAFNVKVHFPSSAGNEYQNAKVIFNLFLGIAQGDNLVINEVFYDVDNGHGLDCPKDRGIDIDISGNGSGSTNIINLNFFNLCLIIQQNHANIVNNVNTGSNTGGNTGRSIFTGSAFSSVNIFNNLNFNFGSCNNTQTANNEWVEIYNPTDSDVELDDWVLVDNSGTNTVFNTSAEIPAGGFALIARDSSTWSFWTEDPDAVKVFVGGDIGDGLGNNGDHLFLKNPDSETVDAVGWEGDTAVWPTNQPEASEGNSIERLSPGFDNDLPTDWEERDPPTPGI